ncbi:STAS domain-containing protein [Oceanidesulfovibrio marinus]|uniref:Anti-sigma factor antagonist n=1 Tax=Oceanidesulfovibrio marinus TaxID=370038 RepID=A0A6P1ZB24_9BACT|nr:STAS domain-containing protein [Oceanidesulfovibrio marinus]TVM26392.1 anti-anti-sigma factor [Oceanidesulfovibrio marinus]
MSTITLEFVRENKQGSHVVLMLRGRLENKTTPEFAKKVEQLVGAGDKRIVVDMSCLEYISSAWLRVLLNAGMHLRAADGGLAICCLMGMVRDVIAVAGFGQMFPLYGTL